MIISIFLAINAYTTFNTKEAYKYGFCAAIYLLITAPIIQILFNGGGTLENPQGDGIITAYIRQATNDGPLMAAWGLLVIAISYIPAFYFWYRANKASEKNKDKK